MMPFDDADITYALDLFSFLQPERVEVLNGLLGANQIGFQVRRKTKIHVIIALRIFWSGQN